jgi:hypothetical protein
MLPRFVRPDKPPQRTSTEDTSPSFRHSIAPRAVPLLVNRETFRKLTPGERHAMKRLMI